MTRFALVLAAFTLCALNTSCASIVSNSTYPVEIDTVPCGHEVTVRNQGVKLVYKGPTPKTLELAAEAGFFDGEAYSVEANIGTRLVRDTLHANLDGCTSATSSSVADPSDTGHEH